MANFNLAIESVIKNEGDFVLHTVEGDRGGMTYAGISKRFHPQWAGWEVISRALNTTGQPSSRHLADELKSMVNAFYYDKFWLPIKGDEILLQNVAQSILDFSVNAGLVTACRLAQRAVKATADGVIGPKTLRELNTVDDETFVMLYSLLKVKRYAEICNKNSDQTRFMLGWVNRTLRALS
jgi:lysozyme family protein